MIESGCSYFIQVRTNGIIREGKIEQPMIKQAGPDRGKLTPTSIEAFKKIFSRYNSDSGRHGSIK
jgi:hypothetical protein